MALEPLPPTIAEIKEALQRDRRGPDRRSGRPDTRVFQWERRVGQRREGRFDDSPTIDDDMIIEITVEEAPDHAHDFEDLTRIREMVA
jgi:hypothetical protein